MKAPVPICLYCTEKQLGNSAKSAFLCYPEDKTPYRFQMTQQKCFPMRHSLRCALLFRYEKKKPPWWQPGGLKWAQTESCSSEVSLIGWHSGLCNADITNAHRVISIDCQRWKHSHEAHDEQDGGDAIVVIAGSTPPLP